jgi:intracellular sulfur oxidation DsrE/DsrF family protein
MKKQVIVLFNYNKGIFTHILLNVLDMADKGYEVGVIFESEACKFIKEFEDKNYDKFEQLKSKKLIYAVCEVCAKAMDALDSAKRQALPINGELAGHPPFDSWLKQGFELVLI